MAVLIDTGVLYALADADDEWHEAASAFVAAAREALIVPVTVVPEVTYLVHERLGARAEQLVVASLAAGELTIEGLRAPDLARALDLLRQYDDIGFVDASLVAIAERLRIVTIATTDRRHFAAIKPKHTAGFTLVPDPPRRSRG